MRPRHPVLLGAALALAAAAPATAPAATVAITADDSDLEAPVWVSPTGAKSRAGFDFDVAIAPGDTVTWNWDEIPPDHNLVSNDANWSHRSEAGALSTSFTFVATGRYAFVCQLHPGSMSGAVVVGNPPPPPPPPLSEQPWGNDSALPSVLETGGLDREAPSVRGVRVGRAANGARIRFRVSERADVTLRFKRGRKAVMTMRVSAAGTYRMTVRPSRKLRAGRYRVEIRARDLAGNASRTRTARLTLR